MSEKLLTLKEVAIMLRVSPKTVRNYINSGKLEAVAIGCTKRVKESVILELLNSK